MTTHTTHMRRFATISAAIVAALAVPAMAFAATPPNVTGLSARFGNGQISLHWENPGDAGITQYRVYYGQRSILANGGTYDDFITTPDPQTDFILLPVPPYPEIFLAVLAVNAAGEESPSFVEEIQLNLEAVESAGQASQSSDDGRTSPSPSRRDRESSTLGLLGAQALSPTSVQLTFNLPVHVPQDRAAEAFMIIDGAGNALDMSRIVIEGSIVTLTTEKQFLGMQYGLRVNDMVTAEAIPGIQKPLDVERSTASFAGFSGEGAVPLPPPPAPVPAVEPTKPSVPAAASVIPAGNAPRGGALPDSGPGAAIAVIAGGAVAGWKKSRRVRPAATVAALA